MIEIHVQYDLHTHHGYWFSLSRHRKNIRTESIRKLSNFDFHWTKILYQNNLQDIAFFLTFSKGLRCNKSSVVTPKKISHGSPRKWMSNFKKLKLTNEIFRILPVGSHFSWNLTFICLTIIPRARMGFWLRGHEGERNNCFSKIQLVGQKYRE